MSVILATSLIVSQTPAETEADAPIDVWVDFVTTSKNATYFLAGAFYKTKGSHLFGLTQVANDAFIPLSASPSSFYTITTSEEGSWSGKLKVRADSGADGFDGQGSYFFRVDRYTGKSANPAESSNSVEIKLLYQPPPTPEATAGEAAPTPAPTPMPTPTPSPKPTPSPTPTPSPSPSPTKRPILPQAKMPRLVPPPEATTASMPAVLGVSDEPEASPSAELGNQKMAPTMILIGSLLLSGGILPLALKLFPRLE